MKTNLIIASLMAIMALSSSAKTQNNTSMATWPSETWPKAEMATWPSETWPGAGVAPSWPIV